MHYCKSCGREPVSFLSIVRHILEEHTNELNEREKTKLKGWLRRKWSCKDCIHCGNIYFSVYDESDLRKACPEPYLFHHPEPAEKCPNFAVKEE